MLPVSRLVNVGINLTPRPAQFPNLTTCLVLGTSDVIDTVVRMKRYSDLLEVGLDFSDSDEEYLSAVLWFEQNPQPTSLLIGRWANVPTPGKLVGGPLQDVDRLVSAWTGIANGSFGIDIDGGGVDNITAVDFTLATNMNGVASIIQAALTGDATCVWDADNFRFIITSTTTGAASSVAFLVDGVGGTNIASKMGGVVGTPGAYLVEGLAAQSALETVQIFDDRFSSEWYGLSIPSATKSDFDTVAPYIEADSIPHFFGQTTQDVNCLSALSTTDIMAEAKDAGYQRSAIQYSSTNAYAVMSLLARILTTNWLGNNTTITLMYKQEPGIVPENLSTTQADAIESKNGNVFVSYNNDTAIIQTGVTPSGQFIDTVIGIDWLRGAVQASVYNLLYGSNKIPQTDAGMHQIATSIESVCAQGVTNGLLAPGVWNAGGFGQLIQGDFLPKGYYVYCPPIATQSQAERAARKSVPFQVAAKLAGAVHTVDVVINVNP